MAGFTHCVAATQPPPALTHPTPPTLSTQDIEVSGDIMAGFKQFVAARAQGAGSPPLDMSVLVLTSGFWPSYRTFDCLLPGELLRAQQVGAVGWGGCEWVGGWGWRGTALLSGKLLQVSYS